MMISLSLSLSVSAVIDLLSYDLCAGSAPVMMALCLRLSVCLSQVDFENVNNLV